MKQAFRYNLIRFQPDVETGEFANIGVVVYAPDSHTLAFRLLAPPTTPTHQPFFQPLGQQRIPRCGSSGHNRTKTSERTIAQRSQSRRPV